MNVENQHSITISIISFFEQLFSELQLSKTEDRQLDLKVFMTFFLSVQVEELVQRISNFDPKSIEHSSFKYPKTGYQAEVSGKLCTKNYEGFFTGPPVHNKHTIF